MGVRILDSSEGAAILAEARLWYNPAFLIRIERD